jgi:aldehyde:ferredoxin oxidoreductase
MYLGGKGLGLKLLYDRLKPGTDPLGEDNYLIFEMGVLMGTGAPCSGRFSAVTKSPLTEIVTTSSCGGPFGMAYKTAGYDALIIRGKSKDPVTLRIDADGAKFENAAELWGKDTEQTQEALKLGKKEAALAIGPAGENGVRFANIRTGHRYFGRGGMGAVMGSKNLKAIVATGRAYRIVPREREKFKKVTKTAVSYIESHRMTGNLYPNYGTNANTNPCNEAKILPVRNFQKGSHEKASQVSGEAMQEKYNTKFEGCKPCVIRCGHVGTHADGSVHNIPEYETVGLLGVNLEVFDSDAITEWNDICGRMGMDTISAGGTLAYAMEAGEKGIFETDLAFGKTEGVSEMLRDIAARKGQGDELANGVRWLSDRYGGKEFAIHVKGLEMPAYDPRGSYGQALSYAVANRGGCHLSAYLIAQEIYFGLLDPRKTTAKAEFTRILESVTACVNSLQTCMFTEYPYLLEPPLTKLTPPPLLGFFMQNLAPVAVQLMDFSVYTRLWSTVTGIAISNGEFLKAGDRIHALERFMNTREGISRKDDTLPDRFLREGRATDPEKRVVPIEDMLNKYYKVRGYDANGIPTPETLHKLNIPARA